MFRKISFLPFFLLLAFAGCSTPLEIQPGLPDMREPLPADTKVFLSGPVGRKSPLRHERSYIITRAFEKALSSAGIKCVLPENTLNDRKDTEKLALKADCNVILYIRVKSWSYADAGFSGFGKRDEIELDVMFTNAKTGTVLQRSRVLFVNEFGRDRNLDADENSTAEILKEFVEKYFDVKK